MTKVNHPFNKTYVLILASGLGKRFASEMPKQFHKLESHSILEHSIQRFEDNKNIDEIIIVTNPLFLDLVETIIKANDYKKVSKIIKGGETRRESSYNGIMEIDDENSIVLIHDAVRPLVNDKIINDCVEKLKIANAVAVAIPASDTIYKINDKAIIDDIPKRKFLLQAQTPQGFSTKLIKKAHKKALNDISTDFSDDVSLVYKYKLAEIHWVLGDENNIKVTYPIHEEFAKIILKTKFK